MATACELIKVSGHVKWFDPVRGFGFIVTENFGDVLLHSKVLRGAGYRPNVPADAIIECEAEEVPGRGYRATAVLSIDSATPHRARVVQVAEALKLDPDELEYALQHCHFRLEQA